jgi:hypothetical protein
MGRLGFALDIMYIQRLLQILFHVHIFQCCLNAAVRSAVIIVVGSSYYYKPSQEGAFSHRSCCQVSTALQVLLFRLLSSNPIRLCLFLNALLGASLSLIQASVRPLETSLLRTYLQKTVFSHIRTHFILQVPIVVVQSIQRACLATARCRRSCFFCASLFNVQHKPTLLSSWKKDGLE